jgi:predicted secreted protein
MKMKKVIVIAMILCLSIEFAKADFTFGEPVNLGSPINTSSNEATLCLSADDLQMYISSNRPGTYGIGDIWVSARATINDNWTNPENLGSVVNSSFPDTVEYISPDGLELYFDAFNRPGGKGGWDIWRTVRASKNDPWSEPTNLGTPFNTSNDDWRACISPDGLNFYFVSTRPGGYGGADIWAASRPTTEDPWGEITNPGQPVNGSSDDSGPCFLRDGLTFLFQSTRSGGHGSFDLWMTTRRTIDDDWNAPVNLGPTVNTTSDEILPAISADGSIVYFCSPRPGGQGAWDIYQAPIIPVVDLNSDGIIDSADMCIMIDHWGENYPMCDIGPMPLGDGVVDVEDLIVLAEHLFEVYPSAKTVDVSEADNGGQIEVELGKLLVVMLESNPSTGYQWELIKKNESILKQFGQTEFKPSETYSPQVVGAGGWDIFHFKAVSAGQTTLELVYHRSWEEAEPLKTFSIQVIVN